VRTIDFRAGNFRGGGARALPAALAGMLLLAGCGPNDTDSGPGGVTVGEARALDEAAEMLDEQRLPAEALPPPSKSGTAPAPEGSPEAPAAG
jgi:hypothetical protein